MDGHTNRVLPKFTNFQQVLSDLTLQHMYTPHTKVQIISDNELIIIKIQKELRHIAMLFNWFVTNYK